MAKVILQKEEKMKAIISVVLALGVVGATYVVAFFTINFIKVLREWKNEIDVEKKNELKVVLMILFGLDVIYLAIDISLLIFFWNALKNCFNV